MQQGAYLTALTLIIWNTVTVWEPALEPHESKKVWTGEIKALENMRYIAAVTMGQL